MRTTGYRILDEPRPGAAAQWAVNPTWPFFALMLVGGWLAWPWLVFNAIAIGSSTQRREIAWVIAGAAGTAGLVAALLWGTLAAGDRGLALVPYLRLIPIVWRLLVGYVVFTHQQRSFQLFEHFGGTAKNGMVVLIAGYVFGSRLIDELVFRVGGPDTVSAFFVHWVLG